MEHELRTSVIQGVETRPGTYSNILKIQIIYNFVTDLVLCFCFLLFYVLALRLTPDKLVDSVPYKDEECDTSNKNADTSISKDTPK